MDDVSLRRLRYFLAVAEELHFGRAAARLNMAQPPLSRQIRRLEEEFGTALLDRRRGGIVLTHAGQLLVTEAERLLLGSKQMVDRVRRCGEGAAGRLTIGFVRVFTPEVLPLILRPFYASYPDVELVLREWRTSREVLESLLTREVDIALMRGDPANEMIEIAIIRHDRLVAALPADHRLAAGGALRVSALEHEPFVLLSRQVHPAYHAAIQSVCLHAGFVPRVVQEADAVDVMLSYVSAGIGVALAPSTYASFPRPQLVYRELLDAGIELQDFSIARRLNDSSALVDTFWRAAVAATDK